MRTDHVVPSLTAWGLTAHADLVYRTLYTFGPDSEETLTRALGLPSAKTHHALDELASLGCIAAPAAGNPTSAAGTKSASRLWIALPATEVLPTLREQHRRAAAARHRLRGDLIRLGYPEEFDDPDRVSSRLIHRLTREQAQHRMNELCATPGVEWASMQPVPAISSGEVKSSAATNRGTLDHYSQVLSLGVPASETDESGWHDLEMQALGMQYRELPELPTKMFIANRSVVLLPINPADSAQGYWDISEPRIVEHLTDFHQRLWHRASVPALGWIPSASLSPRETSVITLMAAGYTDAAIAAKLGISVRTIAYTISGLMDRYDVNNRFQLGLRLGAEEALAHSQVEPSADAGRLPAEHAADGTDHPPAGGPHDTDDNRKGSHR